MMPLTIAKDVFHSAELKQSRFGGLKRGAVFNAEDLQVLMTAVLSDEDGMVAMRRGIAEYHQHEFAYIAALRRKGSPEYHAALKEAVSGYAKLHGECMEMLGDTKIAHARARDAWMGAGIEWSRKGVQIGIGLASKALVPEAFLAPDVLAGVALDGVESKAKEAFADSASNIRDSQNSAASLARSESQRELLITLYRSGIITDRDIERLVGDPEKYEYVRKWFKQHWGELGADADSADNYAFFVGSKACPEFDNYGLIFDSSFIKYFSN